jgi:hypothetical protein
LYVNVDPSSRVIKLPVFPEVPEEPIPPFGPTEAEGEAASALDEPPFFFPTVKTRARATAIPIAAMAPTRRAILTILPLLVLAVLAPNLEPERFRY